MRIGLLGLPNSGKKTIFSLLTRGGAEGPVFSAERPLAGVGYIYDARFDALVTKYRPQKEARASITIDLLQDASAEALREGSIFRDIAGMDALCCVVRAFSDDSVYHANGSVDALRDTAMIFTELVLHDLLFVEKRLERLQSQAKKPGAGGPHREEELMLRMKEHLEKELPLRAFDLSGDELKTVAGYPLITIKKMIIAVNVSEEDLQDCRIAAELRARWTSHDISVMHLSARLESEIAALEEEKERRAFMEAAGIAEPAIDLLSRTCMDALGLLSFFTVGKDEVRQWLIRRGASAREAGGAIHSDIQRGFIRAEVMKYTDLMDLGSEEAVKKSGKMLLMGKDYIVENGDIICFRFNV
jgi:GTP-binding protein YchF